jgi:hypothetical protein
MMSDEITVSQCRVGARPDRCSTAEGQAAMGIAAGCLVPWVTLLVN